MVNYRSMVIPTAGPFVLSPEVKAAIEALQRLAELFEERRQQLAREAGLTIQQWQVLEEICEEHFMPSMFARERESSAAAVSKILRQLLDRGLVQVAVSETDGRQRCYGLTEEGRRIMDHLRASRRKAIEAVWGDLDAAGLACFTEFSSELVRRLEAYAARGGEES